MIFANLKDYLLASPRWKVLQGKETTRTDVHKDWIEYPKKGEEFVVVLQERFLKNSGWEDVLDMESS